jgi:hypothetical protein
MANFMIRDGISQDDRLLPALKEGYFNVDEMRFEDLLSLGYEYANLLKYYDSANQQDGSWREFFEADEAFILASILATNPHGIEIEVSTFIRESGARFARLQSSGIGVEEMLPFRLASKIDFWFVGLGKLSSTAAVQARENIRELIEKTLKTELQQLHLFLRRYHKPSTDRVFQAFSPIWECDGRSKVGLVIPDLAVDHQAITPFLKANAHSFYNALLFLQRNVRSILEMSLERRDHDPAMGLHFAFLKLFKKAQDKINCFTARHLNFYYEEVLKVGRREFVPDSVWLIFSPDIPGRKVIVKRDTEFRAGLDEKNAELFYAADNDLLMNDARVCSLHTLYLERDSLSSPENSLISSPANGGPKQQFVTSVKLNRMADLERNIDLANRGMLSYPLFGVPLRSSSGSSFENARIGFAVASEVLLLRHGRRDIVLTFKLASDAREDKLTSFSDTLGQVLATTKADAFFKAFRHMFKVSLTGETGWFDVAEYLPLGNVVDPDGCEDNSFKVQIRLSDGDGAVVSYSPAIHGEHFDTDLPIIMFSINPDGYLYPYSLLCQLEIKEILVEVDVKGGADVLIYNQYGPLNANAQFPPFGATPALGDYLIVGSYEATLKKLMAFEVEVEWGGLPQEPNGFAEYYQAYPTPIDNSTFRVSLSVLRDRKWIPAEDSKQPQAGLFESGNAAGTGKLGRKRRFSFQGLCSSLKPVESVVAERYGYDAQAKDGFFRLTLDNPPCAFGHKDYSLILSKVMIENTRLKKFFLTKFLSRSLQPKPLPKPPYTPLINAISINYKAVSRISLDRIVSGGEEQLKEKIFHLHPLGMESISPKNHGRLHLVPKYEADGNLFIGLTASKLSGLLTLFFHLREDSQPEASTKSFEFSWYYLASNRWRPFKKSQVVSDTTNGFLSSGIVTLDIPDDINRENTIFPRNLYWIKVSANNDHLNTLCSLYGVHTQVLKASWRWQGGDCQSHLARRLPAGTIKEARSSIPGVGEVRQITDSFGGEPPENDRQWTIRVSERLRHKNRAVTPSDYESLILQQFPDIFKVKCFPCMTDDEERGCKAAPGHLLIVLIPYLREPASSNLRPMVNALLLREIRNFVAGLSSPFVKLTVRNPAYEQIQVRCKVKFKRGMGRGSYLNRLNEEIVNYFSPWSDLGFEARFGWRVRCNDVQSHIQGFPYIDSVSGLSMLRIVESDDRQRYRLTDTARDMATEIVPFHPWSIAIPFMSHLIEVADERGYWPTERAGIESLAIGSTFILSGGGQ